MDRLFLDVADADALLRGMIRPFPVEKVPLWEAQGRVLREPVKADAAYPPFARVCMDGFALRREAWAKGARSFPITGYAPAGKEPPPLLDPDSCIEVMTGTALPSGCDCIVPVEQVLVSDGSMEIKPGVEIHPGQHVHAQGRDYQAGDILLEEGTRLLGPHLAAAAAVGCSRVMVAARPRIILIVTGDELVPVEEKPRASQIRVTHPYALQGLLHPWADFSWTHARDDARELRAAIASALSKAECLLITGGVSAGKHDLVPETLENLGAKRLFHKIRQRPGKPIWVGESREGKPIFAFPGNPVAATVCTRRYLLPWLWRSLGMTEPLPLQLPLSQPMKGLDNLTLFAAVRRQARADGSWEVHSFRVQGSGDFAGLAGSQGFVEIPAGRSQVETGELLPYYDWDFA